LHPTASNHTAIRYIRHLCTSICSLQPQTTLQYSTIDTSAPQFAAYSLKSHCSAVQQTPLHLNLQHTASNHTAIQYNRHLCTSICSIQPQTTLQYSTIDNFAPQFAAYSLKSHCSAVQWTPLHLNLQPTASNHTAIQYNRHLCTSICSLQPQITLQCSTIDTFAPQFAAYSLKPHCNAVQ